MRIAGRVELDKDTDKGGQKNKSRLHVLFEFI